MIEFLIIICFILARLIAGCVSALPTAGNYNEIPQPQFQLQ
jgi:hypothetical protein